MKLCTSLSQRVLDLEKTKISQAAEITELKKRVKKLEKKGGSRTHRLRRLYKGGRYARVVSSEDEGLGDQEDASKQERKIDEIDQDAERKRPKARGVVVQEPSEFTTTTSPSQPSQLPQAKDKGKAKIVEPEKPLKKKDQIMFDKEVEEQGELTIEEKSRLFVELMNKRKKHFARLVHESKEEKSPTKAQKRNIMSTYLKNMAGYKHNKLKTKSFEDIQMLFDKEMKRVNIFVDMDTELVKGNENVEAEVDDDQEEAEMKKYMEIVPDDEVAIDAIPLATKPPIIMLKDFDRKDLETLWKLVKAKHGSTRLEEGYERVLWGDMKVMFEPDVESEVWRNQQGHKVTVWKLFSSSGVHFVRFQNLHIFAGQLVWPSITEDGVTRLKEYVELTPAEAMQADCDIKAINIILQGLPTEIYALVSQHQVAKDLWEKIKTCYMQGTSLTKRT
ncbi:hypothetical protein Tco_0012026 [Tanacetum coccineum]